MLNKDIKKEIYRKSWKIINSMKNEIKENFQAPSIGVFIGHYNYPNVNAGLLSSFNYLKNFDGMDVMNILMERAKIVNSRKSLSVKKSFDKSKEIVLAEKPVQTEIFLKKLPTIKLNLSKFTRPILIHARLNKFKLVENPRIRHAVEKIIDDAKNKKYDSQEEIDAAQKEINNKISYLTVKTDNWEKNIADILKWELIFFEKGKISTKTSKLKEKTEIEFSKAIDNVLEKYGLESKSVQINFTVDKWWLFSSDSLNAIDVRWERKDNLYDILPIEGTIKVEDWVIKSIDMSKIEDNKNYKLQIDKEEKILNWRALKEFINDNKFTPKEKDKQKFDIDKEKLAFEELPLSKNDLESEWITFENRKEQKDGSVKYEFDRNGLWTWSLFVEKYNDWDYVILSPKLWDNIKMNSTRDSLLSDLKKIDELTWLKINLEREDNQTDIHNQDDDILNDKNETEKDNARLTDIEDALNDLNNLNNYNKLTIADIDKIKSEMQDALDGKWKRVKELETSRNEKIRKSVLEEQKERQIEKNLNDMDNFIENNLEEHKFTVNDLFWKEYKDIDINSDEFKWLNKFSTDDVASWIELNWLEAGRDKNWDYILRFEFDDLWMNEDYNKHAIKLETDDNWKVKINKDDIFNKIKEDAKESVKSMKKEEKEK